MNDDLLRPVKRSEHLVKVILLDPRPGHRGRPQLHRIRLNLEPLDSGAESGSKSHAQDNYRDRVLGASYAPGSEEIGHGGLDPDPRALHP